MVQCEDCGDDCQRRTRCPNCNNLVCRWCYHHTHRLESSNELPIATDGQTTATVELGSMNATFGRVTYSF